jgi:signal transduction histidine kinase
VTCTDGEEREKIVSEGTARRHLRVARKRVSRHRLDNAGKDLQMETESRLASLDEGPSLLDSASAASSPFGTPGLAARAGPFAVVAIVAEASLALPPGTTVGPAVIVSLVLLAAVALAFLLPWGRLPSWTPVLVPLACTGWALTLTLAAGTVSGVSLVLLIPLIWSALFHRPWESACVVAAIVAEQIAVSVVQSAPGAVTIRRALLWAALGGLLAVATHGLRDRIRRSHQETARLQERRLRELTIVEDRDRLAAELQSSVVKRLFAAGLKLQGVLSLAGTDEVRRRVESSVGDLDDAIRLLRQAIFGLESRLDGLGLRQRVLRMCAGVSPVPEITFSGPVDDALPGEACDHLLDMLRMALGLIGPDAVQTAVGLAAGQALTVVVTGTGTGRQSSGGNGYGKDLSALRDKARQAGIAIEVSPAADGTRLAWSVPVLPGPPPAG